jgi:hypothetical protein
VEVAEHGIQDAIWAWGPIATSQYRSPQFSLRKRFVVREGKGSSKIRGILKKILLSSAKPSGNMGPASLLRKGLTKSHRHTLWLRIDVTVCIKEGNLAARTGAATEPIILRPKITEEGVPARMEET